MLASGVTLDSHVRDVMYGIRMKNYRYAVFSIENDEAKIVTVKVGRRQSTYDEFLKEMDIDKPCYIAFDFEFVNRSLKSKLILILWISDTAKPRARMLYSSSTEAFAYISKGFMRVQINDAAGLESSEMVRYIETHSSLMR